MPINREFSIATKRLRRRIRVQARADILAALQASAWLNWGPIDCLACQPLPFGRSLPPSKAGGFAMGGLDLVAAAELFMVAVGIAGAVLAAWRSIFRPSERRLRRGWRF